MFTKKTYRNTRRIEQIFEGACRQLNPEDSFFDLGVEWFAVKDEYIVSVFVKEALGDHTWWLPIKYMRRKGPQTVGIVTEHGNWIDILVSQSSRLLVTPK